MELTQVELQTRTSFLLPHLEEALIVPIGDVQYGPEACDIDRFRKHIEWAARQPNAYFLGMGDYADLASPSNRGRLRSLLATGDLYDVAGDALDETAARVVEELCEILEPTRERWLGLLAGHHYWEFPDGSTTDTRLCDYLRAPFLGTCAQVEVSFPVDRDRGHFPKPTFSIWCHHGRGSGIALSSPVNKLEKIFPYFDADVFLLGHHHKKVATKVPRIVTKGGRQTHRNIILSGTGGFLRGYMAGSRRGGKPSATYIEDGMLSPVAMGGVVLFARPRYGHQTTSVDLDISL